LDKVATTLWVPQSPVHPEGHHIATYELIFLGCFRCTRILIAGIHKWEDRDSASMHLMPRKKPNLKHASGSSRGID